jgi:hypothetical protein
MTSTYTPHLPNPNPLDPAIAKDESPKSEMTTFNMRLSVLEKEDWEEFAETAGFKNTKDMVYRAVECYRQNREGELSAMEALDIIAADIVRLNYAVGYHESKADLERTIIEGTAENPSTYFIPAVETSAEMAENVAAEEIPSFFAKHHVDTISAALNLEEPEEAKEAEEIDTGSLDLDAIGEEISEFIPEQQPAEIPQNGISSSDLVEPAPAEEDEWEF